MATSYVLNIGMAAPYVKVIIAFGYVKTPGKKLDMMRIANEDSDSIDGVLIVWTAPLDGRAPAVVVGWYKDATVFRTYQKFDIVPPVHEENGVDGYRFRVARENAVLLPVDSRTHVIPKHKKGLMGEANIWYADTPQANPVVEGVLALINGTAQTSPRRRGRTDPEHNAKVEKAAVKAVRTHYKTLGYAVDSVERDNVGWDLEARLGDRVRFRIEVKGLSGSEPRVGLTPNEYDKFEENAEDYRLAIVTDALSRSRELLLCRFSAEQDKWVVDGREGCEIEIDPRTSAMVTLSGL